ncbi:MAG: hypothetical protein PHH00_00645 [Candidatus Nanoarchaeia archaeon]|nr:hypothetical protein [Candidatus Nanoarchaeia archaeon]
MKKSLIIGIAAGAMIISAVVFLLIYLPKESVDSNAESGNLCEIYNDLEGCSSHAGCEWISNESKCALINITDNEEESNPELNNPELEGIDASKNISNAICNQLPVSSGFGSDDTYYCFAVVNNNTDFCDNMLNDTEDLGIIEESENSEDLNDKTPFYLCLAISGKDSSYCKLASSEDSKKICYNVLAQTSGNINFCTDIDYDQNDKQQCYFNFVNALYWEDKSEEITTDDCDKVGMNGGSLDKNTCLAFKERDVSICGSNKNCLTFFPQEMSFCDGATFKDEEECIRDRAMVNENISICGTFSDQTRRDDCYADFSSHIQPSTAICDKVIGQRKQGCYIDAAINLAK